MLYLRKLRADQVVAVILLCTCITSYRGLSVRDAVITPEAAQAVALVTNVPVPIPQGQAQDPVISASSAAVVDLISGAILYQKNAVDPYLPASTTKLMTALVAREAFAMQDVVTVKFENQVEGSKLGIALGQQYTVETLLKALLVHSANDAGEALAASYPGGRVAFVNRMNSLAEEKHLNHTVFENPTGLDGTHHQTTALDLINLTKLVVTDPELREIVKTRTEYLTDITRTHQFLITNTHELVGVDKTITGVKTGTTEGARQVLITQVERDGHTVLVVVMGSDQRYVDTSSLINWTFATHSWQLFEP